MYRRGGYGTECRHATPGPLRCQGRKPDSVCPSGSDAGASSLVGQVTLSLLPGRDMLPLRSRASARALAVLIVTVASWAGAATASAEVDPPIGDSTLGAAVDSNPAGSPE